MCDGGETKDAAKRCFISGWAAAYGNHSRKHSRYAIGTSWRLVGRVPQVKAREPGSGGFYRGGRASTRRRAALLDDPVDL